MPGNRHARRGHCRKPAGERLEVVGGRVIQKGVAAIEKMGDAARLEVPRDLLRGVEIDRSARASCLRGSGGTAKTSSSFTSTARYPTRGRRDPACRAGSTASQASR